METDQVDTAFKPSEEMDKGIGVALGVVDSGKHSIFKADAALAGEIILPEQFYDISDIVLVLHRH